MLKIKKISITVSGDIPEILMTRILQEAAEITKEQIRYLILGLNPLNPKIKGVNPQSIY